MRFRRKQIDLCTVENQNSFHRYWINYTTETLDRIKSDADKRRRHENQECQLCFYRTGVMACAAMTQAQCGLCDEIVRSGNSNIDALCKGCAKEYGLCKHCGADIDLKNHRNRVIPKPTPTKDEP
jgi:hypothetical protein